MVEQIKELSVWEQFREDIDAIATEYKWRCPNGPWLDIGSRLDWQSNYAEYFMRHFQAAKKVLESDGVSYDDLASVAERFDKLAWTDNYFLETYNREDRRKLEIFISKQLRNPQAIETGLREAIILMLEMQIRLEYEKIQKAKDILRAAEKSSEIMQGS